MGFFLKKKWIGTRKIVPEGISATYSNNFKLREDYVFTGDYLMISGKAELCR